MIQDTFYPSRTTPASRDYILLPGLGLSGRYLKNLALQLALDANVRVLEWRPAAFRHPEHASIAAGAEAVATWMRGRVPEPAVVVGHSFGAQMAAALAAGSPSQVDRLVLLAPTVDSVGRSLGAQLLRLLRDAPLEPLPLILRATSEYLRHWRRVLNMARAALHDPLERWLPAVHMPSLVIRGTKDPLVTADWALRVTFLLRDSQHVTIPGAAHGVPFSAPRQVADAIRHFAVSAPVNEISLRS